MTSNTTVLVFRGSFQTRTTLCRTKKLAHEMTDRFVNILHKRATSCTPHFLHVMVLGDIGSQGNVLSSHVFEERNKITANVYSCPGDGSGAIHEGSGY